MQSIRFALLNLKARFEGEKQRERGATAVEYALIVSLIAVAIITTVALLGDGINATFQDIIDELSSP